VNGVRITAETCPHYLTFTADDVPEGATEFKCAPPLRDARHRAALWGALRAGVLTMVASDHSPAPAAMKTGGDFRQAWGGVASLELSLDAVWTAAGDANAMFMKHPYAVAPTFVRWTGPPEPADLFRWMSAVPAHLAGLAPRKGSLAAGADADLVIWDPEVEWPVDPARLQQRHKVTPYSGRRLRGQVKTTFVRGQRVWHDGALDEARCGRLI